MSRSTRFPKVLVLEMPRYYCDYCDTYLTHDSQAGRKQHNRGWKHRENVKLYYEQFLSGQGGLMMPGDWLKGTPLPGTLPPRGPPGGMGLGGPGGPPGRMPPGMFVPRGLPPRGMMPPPGPGGMMRPPPFQPGQFQAGAPRGPPFGGGGMRPPPRPSIYGPQ